MAMIKKTIKSIKIDIKNSEIEATVFYTDDSKRPISGTDDVNLYIEDLIKTNSKGCKTFEELYNKCNIRYSNKEEFDKLFVVRDNKISKRSITFDDIFEESFENMAKLARSVDVPEYKIEKCRRKRNIRKLYRIYERTKRPENKGAIVIKTVGVIALLAVAEVAAYFLCTSGAGKEILKNNGKQPGNDKSKVRYELEIDGTKYDGIYGMNDEEVIKTIAPKPTATPTPRITATPTSKPTATPTPRITATPTSKPTASPAPRPTASSTPKPTFHPNPGILRSDTAKTRVDKIDFMDVITDFTSAFIQFNYENMASEKDWWTIKVISDAFIDAKEDYNKLRAFIISLCKFEYGAETVKFNDQWTEVSYDELDPLMQMYPTRLAQALVTAGYVPSEYHGIIEQRAEEVDEYYTSVMEDYNK